MLKDADRMEQPEKITGVQEALKAGGHREQLDNATKQDLERELFHTKTQKTANVELKERDTLKPICVQPQERGILLNFTSAAQTPPALYTDTKREGSKVLHLTLHQPVS